MSKINELDAVALTCDLPEHRLARGDVGAAVLVHGKGAAFEVEFVGYDGHTVALLTLERYQVINVSSTGPEPSIVPLFSNQPVTPSNSSLPVGDPSQSTINDGTPQLQMPVILPWSPKDDGDGGIFNIPAIRQCANDSPLGQLYNIATGNIPPNEDRLLGLMGAFSDFPAPFAFAGSIAQQMELSPGVNTWSRVAQALGNTTSDTTTGAIVDQISDP